jgi:hypothetical protein
MNRRRLLALLGVGSVGGVAFLSGEDGPLVIGADPEEDRTPTSPPPTERDGDASNWGRRLQSELGDRSRYGDVSYASTAMTVTVEDSDLLSTVEVEPSDVTGDLFRFTTPDRTALDETVALVRGTLQVSGNASFTASVDGTPVDFSGGQSAVGSFAAATGTHPDRPALLLVRANDPDRLSDVVGPVDG